MQTGPITEPYPEDYTEELIMKCIQEIEPNLLRLQELLKDRTTVQRIFAERVGIRSLAIEDHQYELTYDYGRASKIRLNGKWLEKWGFKTGSRVKIITLPGVLVLLPEEVIPSRPLSNKRPPRRWTL